MSEGFSLATSDDDAGERALKRLNRCDVACAKCHKDKVKCTEERPKCRNCRQAKKPTECVYPVRDRKIIVQTRYTLGAKFDYERMLSNRHQLCPRA
jgi:proline utilization trans-activator